MAVGCSTLAAEEHENASSTLDMPQQPPFHVARPFNSPRLRPLNSPLLLPRKRPLEAELSAFSVDLCEEEPSCEKKPCFAALCPPAKQPRLEFQRNIQILDEVMPATPEARVFEAAALTPEKSAAEAPKKLPSLAVLGPIVRLRKL